MREATNESIQAQVKALEESNKDNLESTLDKVNNFLKKYKNDLKKNKKKFSGIFSEEILTKIQAVTEKFSPEQTPNANEYADNYLKYYDSLTLKRFIGGTAKLGIGAVAGGLGILAFLLFNPIGWATILLSLASAAVIAGIVVAATVFTFLILRVIEKPKKEIEQMVTPEEEESDESENQNEDTKEQNQQELNAFLASFCLYISNEDYDVYYKKIEENIKKGGNPNVKVGTFANTALGFIEEDQLLEKTKKEKILGLLNSTIHNDNKINQENVESINQKKLTETFSEMFDTVPNFTILDKINVFKRCNWLVEHKVCEFSEAVELLACLFYAKDVYRFEIAKNSFKKTNDQEIVKSPEELYELLKERVLESKDMALLNVCMKAKILDGDMKIIKRLIENASNPNVMFEFQEKTALEYIKYNNDLKNQQEILELLEGKKEEKKDLLLEDEEVLEEDIKAVAVKNQKEENLEEQEIVNSKNNENTRKLLAFCKSESVSNTGIKKLLVNKDTDFAGKDGNGKTALHHLCSNEKVGLTMVRTLCRKDVDVNLMDKLKNTPLHEACKNQHIIPDIIQFLIDKKANPAIRNDEGKTALGYARENSVLKDNDKILKLLGPQDIIEFEQSSNSSFFGKKVEATVIPQGNNNSTSFGNDN